MRSEELPAARRSRQLHNLRELTNLNMIAARAAVQRIEEGEPDISDEASAPLALSRATRAVNSLINTEIRVANGGQARPIAYNDPRRIALRGALHPLVAGEPNPARRAVLRTQIDDAIDDSLLADLDEDTCLADIAIVIAKSAGLQLDLAKVTDELLGMVPVDRSELRPTDSDSADPTHPRSRDSPSNTSRLARRAGVRGADHGSTAPSAFVNRLLFL